VSTSKKPGFFSASAKYTRTGICLFLVIAKKSVFERWSKAPTLESVIAKQGINIYGN